MSDGCDYLDSPGTDTTIYSNFGSEYDSEIDVIPEDDIADTTSICHLFESCLRRYGVLLFTLQTDTLRSAHLVTSIVPEIKDEFSRLRIWGEQTYAVLPQNARRSLDEQLREDGDTKKIVIRCLQRLNTHIEKATEYMNRYSSPANATEDEEYSSLSDESEAAQEDLETAWEIRFRKTIAPIFEGIRSLYRVSVLLRRYRNSSRYLRSSTSTAASQDALRATMDYAHISEKTRQWRHMAMRSESQTKKENVQQDIADLAFFCERLARANLFRRKQFEYWVDHPDVPETQTTALNAVGKARQQKDKIMSAIPTSLSIVSKSALGDNTEREVDGASIDACLICLEEMSLDRLFEHLATHMEEIALFVLPVGSDGDEDEQIRPSSVQPVVRSMEQYNQTEEVYSRPDGDEDEQIRPSSVQSAVRSVKQYNKTQEVYPRRRMMMEPVTIFMLTNTVTSLSASLTTLINNARNNDRMLEGLGEDLSSFKTVINRVEGTLNGRDIGRMIDEEDNDIFVVVNDTFKNCLAFVNELSTSVEKSRSKRTNIVRLVNTRYRDNDRTGLQRRIVDSTRRMQIALQIITLQATFKISDRVEKSASEIANCIKSLEKGLSNLRADLSSNNEVSLTSSSSSSYATSASTAPALPKSTVALEAAARDTISQAMRRRDDQMLRQSGVMVLRSSSSRRGPRSSATAGTSTRSPMVEAVVIAVCGMTGSGKSNFISKLAGKDIGIGHGLESKTDQVYQFDIPFEGRHVTLVDTPGFADTSISDTDVLKMIAGFMASSYQLGILLSGIIYLHAITHTRVKGPSLRNIHMF
ncbi:unnamed protein product [Aureobasidium mustum]|uniref:G domain-containing protein n=1 Tax=Aureobasidium mustum TaxID=2773714 RepID=A0A9N8K5U9_9PEZI|nr:unnamed protein product [Aureobasidium mustum]